MFGGMREPAEDRAASHAAGADQSAAGGVSSAAKPFDLLRWFSIASLGALLPVAALTGSIFSHFVTGEALQRDASLTAEFIQNCVDVEGAQIGTRPMGLAQFLDPRVDPRSAGISPEAVAIARANVYEHLEKLPDVLLTSVYARDGRIVWSTNKTLVGTYARDNAELQEAFASRVEVARQHDHTRSVRDEQRFVVQPKNFFIENYVPLVGPAGEVVAVAEVYKEPRRLMSAIRRGQVLVWCTTLVGGLIVWLGLFSIIRRASRLLREQERQLVDAEARVFMGEMATALAHSLRNPLASMRSSAELAQLTDDGSVRKNAQDIITQVDFLSRWVREMLLYSRPLTGDAEPVDLCAVLASVLDSFRPAFERSGVKVVWEHPAPDWRPFVEGNTSIVTQALHGVVSNAMEAMPRGGEIRIELFRRLDPDGVELVVGDTGIGMSPQQLAKVFKPFNTTKAHGVGIGLPMLKRAMERFGGSVTISSVEAIGTQVRLIFKT